MSWTSCSTCLDTPSSLAQVIPANLVPASAPAPMSKTHPHTQAAGQLVKDLPSLSARELCLQVQGEADFTHCRTPKSLGDALSCDLAEAPKDGPCGHEPSQHTHLHVWATAIGHPPRSGSCFSSFLPFHRQPFQVCIVTQAFRPRVLNEAFCTELIKTRESFLLKICDGGGLQSFQSFGITE